jgi:hypothetical protein
MEGYGLIPSSEMEFESVYEKAEMTNTEESTSDSDSIIKSTEYTYWGESEEIAEEIDITLEYTSDTEGYMTIDVSKDYFDDGTSENNTDQFTFKYNNGTGWYDVYTSNDEEVEYSFEILHGVNDDGVEYEYMNLLDTSTYDYNTFFEMEYARNHVG